jgi:broad specificity phosphatase PhoE
MLYSKNSLISRPVMTLKITYFVHGTTIDNEQNISSGRNDIDLSELGVQQSLVLNDTIKDIIFDAVFSSDLLRASHSAQLMFGDRIPVILDARLRECNYGEYNGKSSDIVEPMQEQSIYTKFPNGESYEDVKARIAEFLASAKQQYDDRHIAIIWHKAPQLALDVLIHGKTWEQAFAEDWRKMKARKPGWEYIVE